MKYYEKLRYEREQRKISQLKMSELIGTNQKQISRYETGENQMTVPVFKKWCEVLNVSADEILEIRQ